MRIFFANLAQAEALSKRVASVTRTPLRKARDAAAAMAGYDSWKHLAEVTDSGDERPSLPDEVCSTEVVHTRVLYQVARLSRFLSVDEDEAAAAVSHIRPTNAFFLRYSEVKSPADKLFPNAWTGTAAAEEEGERFLAEIGGPVQRDTLSELACGKEEGAAILDPATGVRVLAAYSGKPNDGVSPGDPYAVVVFRLVPIVQEQVVTHIELRLVTFMAAEEMSESALVFVGSAIRSYLNQPTIHWQCDGDLCGAAEGITLTLHGTIGTDEERALIEMLDAALIDAEENWHKVEDCLVMSTQRLDLLPLATFLNEMQDLSEDEEDAPRRAAVHFAEGTAAFNEVCDAMQQAPARLSSYLEAKGRAEFADFARVHDISTMDGICRFLKFVRVLAETGTIGIEVAVFIRNHFITTGDDGGDTEFLLGEISSAQDDPQKVIAAVNERIAVRAVAMDCDDMVRYYLETPTGRLAEILSAGESAFLGRVEDR